MSAVEGVADETRHTAKTSRSLAERARAWTACSVSSGADVCRAVA
ncbi:MULTISPECIES: hypothetical protein [Pseudomonas syringae group]|nr:MULTISPECIES: hypothetical protein [Pseudomonas syringae group]